MFIYNDNADDFLNKYSDQILNSSLSGSKYKPVIVSSSKSIIDTMFAITKSYRLIPLEKKADSDTIIDHGGYFPPQLILQENSYFGNNLGLISALSNVYSGGFISTYSEKLIGCIKNGVIHGTILSDSLFNSISDSISDSISEGSIEDSIFNVYPNPANFEITIEYLGNNKNCTLTVLNINGQELIRQQIINRKTKIDISNLKKGTYILKVITDKTVEVRKIIKE